MKSKKSPLFCTCGDSAKGKDTEEVQCISLIGIAASMRIDLKNNLCSYLYLGKKESTQSHAYEKSIGGGGGDCFGDKVVSFYVLYYLFILII